MRSDCTSNNDPQNLSSPDGLARVKAQMQLTTCPRRQVEEARQNSNAIELKARLGFQARLCCYIYVTLVKSLYFSSFQFPHLSTEGASNNEVPKYNVSLKGSRDFWLKGKKCTREIWNILSYQKARNTIKDQYSYVKRNQEPT